MAEYIEREEAKDVMALIVLEAIAHPDTYTCGEAKRAIESIPAADVQPVKHGKWISVGHKLSRICSVCDCDEPYKFADDDANAYNYCPNCGAMMKDGENNAE